MSFLSPLHFEAMGESNLTTSPILSEHYPQLRETHGEFPRYSQFLRVPEVLESR